MHTITIIFLVALFCSLFIQLWLIKRNISHIQIHRAKVPDAFSDKINLDDHQKAADYSNAKLKFSITELVFSSFMLVVWTLGGGLQYLDNSILQYSIQAPWNGVAVFLALFLIMGVIDLPFGLYRTFKIEQQFGFNKSTLSIYFIDLIKQTVLMLVIATPLLALVLWLMQTAGEYWWFYVWFVWMSFSLLMMWAYPAFIAPLFNKFKELDDKELKATIDHLLIKCGFSNNGIYIMDGSRRSSHGNAYFTGMGNNKRIVFFDTLLESLNAKEIEAVLAHELGHFKHKHIIKHIVVMAVLSLSGLALLGWLMQLTPFYTALGVDLPSTHMALILFLLVSPVFSIYLQPVMAYFSRKHEFEADNYASKQSDAKILIQALVKLYKENANTLTPDPLYSAFHDSHPPASVRIANLTLKTTG
ncbi:MAG: M48 family metallopeptidase [Gammaproteobacteria bacterium]